MQPIKRLIREAHRRSMWQVLGIYLLGAWLGYQVVLGLYEGLGLPDWVPAFTVILFVIGLPIVLATAFVQEGVPLPSSQDPTLLPGLESNDDAPEPATAVHGLLTWRRALLGGVAAFTLLGATTGGWLGMRTLGIGPVGSLVAKGVLEERDRVILADFEAVSGDSALADLVTEALRIDLLQSTVLTLAEPSWLSGVLERMQREPQRLELPLALEVAEREGVKAVIAGEVGQAGASYILTATLVMANGDAVAGFRETARDSTELLDAIDRLSGAVRSKVGESLATIRAGEPLEQVTTSSLEALRLFTTAERENGPMALLDRAIELDSTFAMAYRKKALWLANSGQDPSGQVEALRQAYRYRDRLSPVERHLTMAAYSHSASENLAGAIAAYEAVLELDPTQPSALNNLPVLYARRKEYARAEELLLRGLDTTTFPTHYGNLIEVQLMLGKPEAAASTLQRAAERFPESEFFLERTAAGLAESLRQFERADSLARILDARGTDGALYWGALLRHPASAASGRVRQARALTERILGLAEKHDLPHLGLSAAVARADLALEVLGDTAAALDGLEAVLARHPLESLDPLNRPYLELVHLYARAAQVDRARSLLDEYERVVPADGRGDFNGEGLLMARRARAAISLAEGRVDEALEGLREADRDVICATCHLPELGRAYEAAGLPDSALVAYDGYLDRPFPGTARDDARYLAQVLLRAAELHETRGEPREAAALYSRLVELWKDADPELQGRVEEARRRAGSLLSES